MSEAIYFNGDILTMEGDVPRYVEALFIRDGRILATGTKSEMTKLVGKDTKLMNLQGRTLMPAFLDPHSHITACAEILNQARLGSASSFDELAGSLKKFLEKNPPAPGEFLMGFGYDHNNLEEGMHPTREVLDRVSADIPVIAVHASGHMAVLNTLALSMLGIGAQTPEVPGGRIGREADGKTPDGYLEEKAFMTFSSKIPRPSAESAIDALEKAQDMYVSYGITTIQDGLTEEASFALLKEAAAAGRLKTDIVCYADLLKAPGLVQKEQEYDRRYHRHLKIGGYKIILDGSPQGRTAWLSKPYEDAKDGYSGYPVYTQEQVDTYVERSKEEGRQLLVHCNGDAAAEQMIRACRKPSKLRPVMIHAQTVRREQLVRMKELGIIPSFFIAHVYHWGEIHRKNLGEERSERISPAREAADLQMPYTFHQDTPVIEPDMLETVWCAVNRKTRSGRTLGEEYAVTPYEALQAVTCYAAFQYFEEDDKGTLSPGKLADMIILSENPLKAEPDEIRRIRVLATLKEGELLYEAPKETKQDL